MDIFSLGALFSSPVPGPAAALKHRFCSTRAFGGKQNGDPAPSIHLAGVSPSTSGDFLSPRGREANLLEFGIMGLPAFSAPVLMMSLFLSIRFKSTFGNAPWKGCIHMMLGGEL